MSLFSNANMYEIQFSLLKILVYFKYLEYLLHVQCCGLNYAPQFICSIPIPQTDCVEYTAFKEIIKVS